MRGKDITGQKFNRLTAIEYLYTDKHHHQIWLFLCDCGTYRKIDMASVKSGHTVSCGCYGHEIRLTGDIRRKHGQCGTRLYGIWKAMRYRCNAKNLSERNKHYKDITYCEQWEKFEPFYEWAIQNGYRDDLSIDRIDNNKGYSPDNCRWATAEQQANNKSTTRYVTYKGIRKPLSDWAKQYMFHKSCFYEKLKKGMTEEEVIASYAEKI